MFVFAVVIVVSIVAWSGYAIYKKYWGGGLPE